MKYVLQDNGVVEYHPDFLSQHESEHYYRHLVTSIEWRQDQLIMFGKAIITKRKIAWYGDKPYEYIYSKNKKVAKPWTKALKEIKLQLERYSGEDFNACLLNYYHDGSEGMGWHSDNEKMMKKHATIASISLGANREFMFRHKHNHKQCSLELESGSLLLMKAETQDYWKHQLPIRKRIKTPRINLTFRYFDELA